MQKYVLSELDSGQRVITERIPSVRSVALGFWIGAGSRDETPSKAGITHFIEHLLFKGTRSYSAQDIAEIFDALGGELNAATSREHTLVYVRVADHHLEKALDVMSDMVYAPLFADLDSEREVVLEEIAMYEDTPHELVHDLMSEAVFGDHPLGRPVIGTADVISSVGRRALTTLPPDDVPGRQRRGRGRREPEARRPRRAPPEGGAQAGEGARQGPAPPQPARAAAAPERALPAQAHRAVPRLHRRPRDRALGSPPLHRVPARRAAGRVGLVTALPGDPREAGHGLFRLHVRVPVHGQRADRLLRRARAPRTSASAWRSRTSRSTRSPRAGSETASSSGPRRTSRDGSCSRWSRPRTG